mmetsp:Transcript_18810/g.26396  ORF Transcript_18810/g.26396 Transcript_18810/m.26396 type:complete len:348 (+) Transcript_18810:921-1964(+)
MGNSGFLALLAFSLAYCSSSTCIEVPSASKGSASFSWLNAKGLNISGDAGVTLLLKSLPLESESENATAPQNATSMDISVTGIGDSKWGVTFDSPSMTLSVRSGGCSSLPTTASPTNNPDVVSGAGIVIANGLTVSAMCAAVCASQSAADCAVAVALGGTFFLPGAHGQVPAPKGVTIQISFPPTGEFSLAEMQSKISLPPNSEIMCPQGKQGSVGILGKCSGFKPVDYPDGTYNTGNECHTLSPAVSPTPFPTMGSFQPKIPERGGPCKTYKEGPYGIPNDPACQKACGPGCMVAMVEPGASIALGPIVEQYWPEDQRSGRGGCAIALIKEAIKIYNVCVLFFLKL